MAMLCYNIMFDQLQMLQASSSINAGNFTGLDYNAPDHHHQPQHQQMNPSQNLGESSSTHQMVDYMIHHQHNTDQQQAMSLSFADVMQFADFGPKLALNQGISSTTGDDQEEENVGMDSVYFLKFPVLNERLQDHDHQSLMNMNAVEDQLGHDERGVELDEAVPEPRNNSVHELRYSNSENVEKLSSHLGNTEGNKGKRKRPRSVKTTEEVESQRMTHIAVERNRRKQMNEHLRVLRSLMPGSYVQRGDQASIIGGAIEFVRELEQLLQCLESQKRRRLYGETGGPTPKPGGDASSSSLPMPQPPPFFPSGAIAPPLPHDQLKLVELETGLQEEAAESKSCLADVEVKLVGYDALIKVLSRRRQGQLIKAIAALEDMQLNILHTNVTTIEQTVLYSFNVKIDGEARFSAEDIANSVQQIFTFIHAST